MKKYTYLVVILILIFSSNLNAQSQYPVGSVFGPSGPTKVVDVTNPKTGRTWMDRNLGATRAATSSTDAASYGDLYQWGRGADGHQLRTSAITVTLSGTDKPRNSNFITYYDWRSPQNNNLWQGVNGINNPCPSGYRIPTTTELKAEIKSWSSNDAKGAFSSPLKLPMAGRRDIGNGVILEVGNYGNYSSSTVTSTVSDFLYFDSSEAYLNTAYRAFGHSIRCIKN